MNMIMISDRDDQDNDFDDHDDQDTLECSLQTVLPHRDQLARRVFMFRSLQSTIYNYRITVLAMKIMRISVAVKGLSSAGMMLEIV